MLCHHRCGTVEEMFQFVLIAWNQLPLAALVKYVLYFKSPADQKVNAKCHSKE